MSHLQADCREPALALEPYAQQSSMGYLYLFIALELLLSSSLSTFLLLPLLLFLQVLVISQDTNVRKMVYSGGVQPFSVYDQVDNF